MRGTGGESPCWAPTHPRADVSGVPVCTLTPHNQVSRGFVDPPRVGGQAGIGPSIRDVRGADEQTARLQQRETWQLDRAAGQDTLP